MSISSDYSLGQTLARLIAQQGGDGFDSGRILGQVQDLLGADTTLLGPLRDLVIRPAFRGLFSSERRSQTVGSKDALLADLSLTYSPLVVQRLQSLLNGCLGLPDVISSYAETPSSQQHYGYASAAPTPIPIPTPVSTPPYQPTPQYIPVPQPLIQERSNSSLLTGMIALFSVLVGGLIVGLGAFFLLNQQKVPQAKGVAPTPMPQAAPPVAPAPPQSPAPSPSPKGSTSDVYPGWGPPSSYKFGRGPGGEYPNSCGFSETDANGEMIISKSRMEYWACRDEGGNPSNGYAVTWSDGKRTNYTFGSGGQGAVIGTNGTRNPIQWRNDVVNGDNVIVISHQDGATSWVPGHVGD